MKLKFSKQIWNILACPYCGGFLSRTNRGTKCHKCQEEYVYSNEGQLDLRLRQKKLYCLQFELGANLLPERRIEFKTLQKCTSPQVDFIKIKVPWHLTKELMTYFPKAKGNAVMLDLGCGSTIHREVCEYAGFEYVGLDYSSPEAPILGDAHSLPFKNNSFDFILSIAVLEHIQFPFVAMSEVYRVLKPGGKLIGTVSFLEPFHDNSFYHHTHLGVLNSLHFADFNIEHIAPSAKWSVLKAQASMSLFPELPRLISNFLILPIELLHKIWWKFIYLFTHSEKVNKKNRILTTTGSFTFIASKKKNSSLVIQKKPSRNL